jgi:hypothetical protein
MSTLFDQVKSVFDRYGVPAAVWYPIAYAESGFNPDAVGDNGASIGLFQINRVNGQGIGYTADQLRDPVTNAEVAARAIVPAYRALESQVAPSQLAAEVARRSGHPGGSLDNPFPATDPRILRIQQIATQFFAALTGNAGQTQTPDDTVSQVSVLEQIGNQIIALARRVPTPTMPGTQTTDGLIADAIPQVTATAGSLQAIGDVTKQLSDRFSQMGAPGFLLGTLGVLVALVALAAMFAETDAGKSAMSAAKTAAMAAAE